MKCPFCNLEMMEGYLKAGRYVQFQEMENGRKGQEYLVAKSFMGDAKMEGYLCPSWWTNHPEDKEKKENTLSFDRVFFIFYINNTTIRNTNRNMPAHREAMAYFFSLAS